MSSSSLRRWRAFGTLRPYLNERQNQIPFQIQIQVPGSPGRGSQRFFVKFKLKFKIKSGLGAAAPNVVEDGDELAVLLPEDLRGGVDAAGRKSKARVTASGSVRHPEAVRRKGGSEFGFSHKTRHPGRGRSNVLLSDHLGEQHVLDILQVRNNPQSPTRSAKRLTLRRPEAWEKERGGSP